MRVSPSASLKLPLTSTLASLPPTVTVCAEMEPTAVGALFGLGLTVTEMVWVALALLGSEAVTVTVALPSDTGLMLTVEPDTLAVALALSDELAV